MVIKFNEEEHTYKVDGQVANLSVTELLHKHGLAPNYDGVDKDVLKAKAKRGTEIHKDLENILNLVSYEPTTKEGENFLKWAKNNIISGVGEQMVGCEFGGLILAGTADIVGFDNESRLFIGDHKTTTQINKEYVAWQVSLLDYMFRQVSGRKINGKKINWKGAEDFYCFHYKKNGKLSVVPIEKVADSEIEKLIECERKAEIYKRSELVIDSDLALRYEKAEQYLAEIEKLQKSAQAKSKAFRELLLDLMVQQGIYTWETDKIKVTRVVETSRIVVDSDKVKKEFPSVYNQCTKMQVVKPQLRVKVRSVEEDEF